MKIHLKRTFHLPIKNNKEIELREFYLEHISLLPARGIFAQLCSFTQFLLISINQQIRYLSKAYSRARALLQTCWGHFRKTNDAFLYQGNHNSGGERKSHYHTQVRSDFAYQPLETSWHFHCSLYTMVPCPKRGGRKYKWIFQASVFRVDDYLEGELWVVSSQRYLFRLCCWDPGLFLSGEKKCWGLNLLCLHMWDSWKVLQFLKTILWGAFRRIIFCLFLSGASAFIGFKIALFLKKLIFK